MSYILGITQGSASNPSAALVHNGKLIAAAEEERFVRIKNAPKIFPKNAIDFCLKYAGISPENVTKIAISFDSPRNYLLKEILFMAKKPHVAVLIPDIIQTYKELKTPILKKEKEKICFFPHHLAHAASTFYLSGFKKSNIITIDGRGETDATTLAIGENKKIEVIKKYSYLNSLGDLWERFTYILGFTPHRHEGKVMGLAPYGKKLDSKGIIKFTKNGYSLETPQAYLTAIKFFVESIIKKYNLDQDTIRFNNLVTKKFGPRRNPNERILQRHADIAATIQSVYEKVLIKLAVQLYELNGVENFSLAGGCALNCSANGRLFEEGFVKDVFIQPAANDAGGSIGAALLAAQKEGQTKLYKMSDAYWGPSYDEEVTRKILIENQLKFEYFKDIAGVCAELIAKKKIVGWFQGRMEIGPRALGNRSILADPTERKMKDIINLKVKHREPWRPFAPSLLYEYTGEYLENPYYSPFMLMSFKVKKEKVKEIPAVVHIDGSTRPQVLRREVNPLYYKMIKEFEKVKGVPCVLNTSFNDKEEPIVCSPQDAINTFKKTSMDYLIIGNYLIKK